MSLANKYVGKDVIVRTYSAGVFAGILETISDNGNEAIIKNVRRLWYWDGAATLSQLALEGVKKPQNCKFPRQEDEKYVSGVIEILPITDQARKSIDGVKIWEV